MAKQHQAQPNLMKYYLIGFVGALVVIGLIALIMSSDRDKSISADDSDAPPTIPSDDEQVVIGGSGDGEVPPIPSDNEATSINSNDVVGDWRVYSSRLFYDDGGGGSVIDSSTASSTKLEIKSNGDWEYGSSSGEWSVSTITDSDWEEWGINSYGPTRKITLDGWKSTNGYASGPIEETESGIDFLWAIYRTGPPTVSKPGQIQTKWGK